MNDFTRRKFLKITSATFAAAGALGMASCSNNKDVKFSELPDGEIKQIPTYCNICFWKCGVMAYVKDGKIWKLEGNPKDPLSRGRLCPRGTGGLGAVYDTDRLQAPLIRKKGVKRGEEKWVVVSWDEALDYIAKKMKTIAEKYGPESVGGFFHGIGGRFLTHTFKAFGSHNITAPSFAQCRGPREVAFDLTYGQYIGSPERVDIENTKCMVLMGSHLGENMHNSQVQEFAEAVKNNASIIVVDPRFSIAAGKAKYYLPIKPGTDLALLLAWMNVLVYENLYDKEFVEKNGSGFEEFKQTIKQYTPEWAFIETGIEPGLIRKTAYELAKNKPAAFIHPGRHVTWYGDDTQRLRAIALANALLGNWNHKGAFFEPSRLSLPSYKYPSYPEFNSALSKYNEEKYPFAGDGEGLTTSLRDATLTGEPHPIKAWFVYATNLIQSMPNSDQTIEAIKKLDLMVVIDTIPSEIAGWADVVLPESTYLERFDELNTPGFKQSFAAIRQPVIESPHDQKPNWWIAKKLAEKLGLGKYYPWKDIEEYLSWRVESGGYSYEKLKKDGIILGPKAPIYVEEGVENYFFTQSEKIEFYSPVLGSMGFDPVPKYKRPEEPPSGYFRLLFGRAPVHTFGKTLTNTILQQMMDENSVWINADIAKRYGLKNGQKIRLKNQDGKISNKVKITVTERIRTDCVYMVHGFGHTSKALKSTFGKGASDSELVTKYVVDPLMGGTGMNVNFVTFETEV